MKEKKQGKRITQYRPIYTTRGLLRLYLKNGLCLQPFKQALLYGAREKKQK